MNSVAIPEQNLLRPDGVEKFVKIVVHRLPPCEDAMMAAGGRGVDVGAPSYLRHSMDTVNPRALVAISTDDSFAVERATW